MPATKDRTSVRGVYRPNCLSPEGFPYLFGVTRDNRKVIERPIYPFECEVDVAREVWRALNRLDPLR